jgi:hypothetical protein
MIMFKVGDKVKRIVDVAPLRKGEIYTVSAVDEIGFLGVAENYGCLGRLDYTPFDPINFEFVASSEPFKQHINEDEIVVEWLKKLQWLRQNDKHIYGLSSSEIALSTDFGDVYGAANVVSYVNTHYDNHMQAANAKRKESLLKELQEKEAEVAKLKAELEAL